MFNIIIYYDTHMIIDIFLFTSWEIGKGGDEKRGGRKIKFVCVCLLYISVYLSYPPFLIPPFTISLTSARLPAGPPHTRLCGEATIEYTTI